MHYRLSRKYGIQISPRTKIGYGLYIGHGVGIIVSHTAVIGNNCNLSQFTTIGSNRSKDNNKSKAAIIGDNVYIGPSVCIVGNVHINNNTTIGAGAVVVKDIPENATVAGVPAKVISYDEPGRFVNKRWSF